MCSSDLTAGLSPILYRGNGVGEFVDASSMLPVAPATVADVALVDFDLDGDLDVAQAFSAWASSASTFRLLRNDWPAVFVDATVALALPPTAAWSVATIDIDRDGRLDLLLGNNGSLPTSNGMLLLRAVGAGFVDETALRVQIGRAHV